MFDLRAGKEEGELNACHFTAFVQNSKRAEPVSKDEQVFTSTCSFRFPLSYIKFQNDITCLPIHRQKAPLLIYVTINF